MNKIKELMKIKSFFIAVCMLMTFGVCSLAAPIPVTYLLICCHEMNNGTRFFVNGQWTPDHDYRNIEVTRSVLQKIKNAGINTVCVDFSNPSMWWDVPAYNPDGSLVNDYSSMFKPMLDNIVQVTQEKNMNFFILLGDPAAWTMKYWNQIAKIVWDDYAQLPNYLHYGYGDDRPLLIMFLYGTAVQSIFNSTPQSEKDYLTKFHIGTCQINGAIDPQPSDGWGYRNYSESSDGNVRFASPNGGVAPDTWYRIGADTWKWRVDWAMKAHHYAVFGSYDDSCDGIFWGQADVSRSNSAYHVNKKTKEDPFIYYNIVRDKLCNDGNANIILTQKDDCETTYTINDKEISLTDGSVESANPMISINIYQPNDNCNVTYRRKTTGYWESLSLPFAFKVDKNILDLMEPAVPHSVTADGNTLQLHFRKFKEGDVVEAWMPILIKGKANVVTTAIFNDVTIQPTDDLKTLSVSGDGFTVDYTPVSYLAELWIRNAFGVINGKTDVSTQQRQVECYPFHFFFTVKDADGNMRYPGKTYPGVGFNPFSVEETPTGIKATMVLQENSPVYNLKGQLVEKGFDMLPSGMYIRDGKKTVKK